MRIFLAWLAILAALPFVIRAGMNGVLSAEAAAILLLLVVFAFGFKIKLTRVLLPIAGVVVLAAQYSGGDSRSFKANLGALLAVSLALLGIYIMISPKGPKKRE
ncbi:MAG: hypothetical protein HYY24_01225 [Verrucomicrobia bacterium]|nr:hypothetical protein [Verrucomicrobiota bacterium]